MKVRLVVVGETPPRLAQAVFSALAPPFAAGGIVAHAARLTRCLDRQRGQVEASCLLETIAPPPPGWAVVGITGADLFVPPLAYIFGLSGLGSRRGVVSWARLRPQGDSELGLAVTARRLSIEVAHELGHGLGLVHCVAPDCAMRRSLWPEAVDLKLPAYCSACLETLLAATGETW